MPNTTVCVHPQSDGRPCRGKPQPDSPLLLCLRHLQDASTYLKYLSGQAPGRIGPKGYRKIGTELAHRVILKAVIGEAPHPCHWCNKMMTWGVDLVVDHVDGNKLNNDPHNLVPACQLCNIRRMNHPHHGKTHCVSGHEFTPENTRRGPKGERLCVECRRKAGREWAARNPIPPAVKRPNCPNGHEYNEENTYVTPGGYRRCRACRSERAKQRAARLRGGT